MNETINRMKITKYFILIVFITIFSSCSEKPDAVYTNGKIYTLNANNSVVEAIAVKDGKILDLGSSSEISDKYSAEEEIDLEGATVLPGFIDSEGSIIEFSKNLNYINLSYVRSIGEISALVSEKVRNTNEGEWIGGYGWSELNIPESDLQKLDKSILDNLGANYNIYLVNASLNAVWVNSRVLRLLKIDKDTPNPPNGEIQKYDDGEPTGLLFDEAVNLVKDNIPALLKTDMISQVSKGLNEIIKYGITEVHDRTVGKEGIAIFRELIDSNRFPMRLYVILSGEDSALVENYLNKGPEINYKDKLTIRSISIDYDGLFEVQESFMNDEYNSDPKRKIPYVTTSDIARIYSKAIDKNFQFCIKAVGDRAVDSSLNVLKKVIKQKLPVDQRIILEHCEFVSPKDLSNISEVKVIPSIRPDICMNDLQIASQMINPENLKKLGLWNSLLKSSGMITTGSDFPFHQINPFIQIYYLTTRQLTDTLLSNISNPDQKISLLDAVKSYTVWPAYASFEENMKGTIEKGKIADMIVISTDIFNSDSKALLNTKVLKTIINGKVVYNSVLDLKKF